MMNILRSHSLGHHHSPSKAEDVTPVVKEVVPSPSASEASDPLDSPLASQSDTFNSHTRTTSKADALTVKRQSRPSFGVRTVSGRYNISTFVREQHSVIHKRCRHELGAEVSASFYNSEFAGLLAWIKSERLTRLPHKGGDWDRVLSAAQYFAEQVQTLHTASQEFTAGSGEAANLIFGQCLLLLEVSLHSTISQDYCAKFTTAWPPKCTGLGQSV